MSDLSPYPQRQSSNNSWCTFPSLDTKDGRFPMRCKVMRGLSLQLEGRNIAG